MGRSTSRLRILAICAVVALALASCKSGAGSGSKGTATPEASPTPAHTIVTSDDGKLVLSIPDGAMPEGTAVAATAVPNDQLPSELGTLRGAGTGYKLEPDGLTFSQPVDVTLTLDRANLQEKADTISAYGLVAFSASTGIDILKELSTTTMLGENNVAVRGKLSHFSYVGYTVSALEGRLEIVKPQTQLVGSTFSAAVTARNTSTETVRLTNLSGRVTASLALELVSSGEVLGAIHEDELNTGSAVERMATFTCKRVGSGGYNLHLAATAVVIAEEAFSTPLQVNVSVGISCVDKLETPDATAAEDQKNEVVVTTTGGCEHTNPGVESEVRELAQVEHEDGSPVAGAQVESHAEGPGLIEDTTTATTDASGDALLAFRINLIGPYTMTVTKITLTDGTELTFDPSSVLQVAYTVGQVCATPEPP